MPDAPVSTSQEQQLTYGESVAIIGKHDDHRYLMVHSGHQGAEKKKVQVSQGQVSF